MKIVSVGRQRKIIKTLGELEIKITGFIKARLLEFVVASLNHH